MTSARAARVFVAFVLILNGFSLSLSGSALAQDNDAGKRITLELNQAKTVQGKCRATIVVRNGLEESLAKLAFDLVVFDKKGGVVAYSGIDLGHLPAAKMRVRQYDVATVACSQISRLLINEIKQCGVGDEAACLKKLRPASRIDIEFNY